MAVSSGYSATFTLKSYAYHGGKAYVEIAVQYSLLPAAVVESMFIVRRRDL